jgi:serine/threonine protein kinase
MTQQLLADRFRIIEVLGRGEAVTTYLAEDTSDGSHVVVKRFSLLETLSGRQAATADPRDAATWHLAGEDELAFKLADLFEREGRVLSQLRHPSIPRFLDFISHKTDQDTELFLVQEYVSGKNLGAMVADGRHFTEAEIREIAFGLARVLESLHTCHPPLIHRDVKPSNIVIGDKGQVFLIDFGAVKNRVQTGKTLLPTVVGTFGYMPMEQLQGRATPASDIYALGGTLVFLLTHQHPHELPQRRLIPDFRARVKVSGSFASILDRMLAPDPSERYQDGAELRVALESEAAGEGPEPEAPARRRRRPLARSAAWVATVVVLALAGVLLMRSIGREGGLETDGGPLSREARFDSVRPLLEKIDHQAAGLVKEVVEDDSNNVWALSHDSIVRFSRGRTGRPRTMFHRELPIAAQLAEQKIDSWRPFGISSMALGHDGTVWIGSTRGEVLLGRGKRWRTMSAFGDPWRSELAGMVVHNGRLHVVNDTGLWVYDDSWQRLSGAPRVPMSAIHVSRSGDLLVGGRRTVWRFEDAGGKELWQGRARQEDRILALFEDLQGQVLIGTGDGFVTISAAGEDLGRELEGIKITAFASRGRGRLWVGTAVDGLRYREGNLWYSYRYSEGLASNNVEKLLIDRGGRLWCVAGGLLVADAAMAEQRIKTVPRIGQLSAKVFDNAGWAVEKLLADEQVSGGVAWRRTEEHTQVFFDGHLVHPGNLAHDRILRGYRRRDGSIVLIQRDWTGSLSLDGRSTEIPPLEKPRPWDYPELPLLDSRGRVWVSSGRGEDSELHELQEGEWRTHPELSGLLVRGVVEDSGGSIWVVTDRSRGGTLHRWDSKTWTHMKCWQRAYPKAESLSIWGLRRLADGRLVLRLYGSGDAVLFDPSSNEIDCTETLPLGHWDWLSQDLSGRLWLSEVGSGLTWRAGEESGRYSTREGLFSDRVVAHAHDREGRIWVISYDGRVGVFDIDTLVTTKVGKAGG